MAKSQSALVRPALLVWARTQIGMPASIAAKKAAVSEEALASWEADVACPTIRQARLLASAYRVLLAAFYLDKPPASKAHTPKDLRRFAGSSQDGLSSKLQLDIRDAWQ